MAQAVLPDVNATVLDFLGHTIHSTAVNQ